MLLNDHDSDDVTQEVMIKAVRGLSTFKGDSSLATWITRIAINTTYTYLQKRHRNAAESLPTTTADQTYNQSPVHAAMGNELNEQITVAMKALSPTLRAAISLISIQGLSASDAAEIEGCTANTMHWRVHEARKQLKDRLKQHIHTDQDAK